MNSTALSIVSAGLRALQSLAVVAASVPRSSRRDYAQYRTWDLLKAHRITRAMDDHDAILDVGSGTGHRLRDIGLFKPDLARRVGVDLHAVASPPGIDLRTYDGRTLPFDDGEFDVTLICYVLHHLTREHAQSLMAEIVRVTKRKVILLEDSMERFNALYKLRNRVHRFESDLVYSMRTSNYAPPDEEQMFLTYDQWRAFFRDFERVAHTEVESLASISRYPHHTLIELELRAR